MAFFLPDLPGECRGQDRRAGRRQDCSAPRLDLGPGVRREGRL